MSDTETLDRLYLEWSQFTKAKTGRELALERSLQSILNTSMQATRTLDDFRSDLTWINDEARRALEPKP